MRDNPQFHPVREPRERRRSEIVGMATPDPTPDQSKPDARAVEPTPTVAEVIQRAEEVMAEEVAWRLAHPRPVPSQRTHTWEQASAAAQKAVKAHGGVQAIVTAIQSGFHDRCAPGRRAALEQANATALAELAAINETSPRSTRAADLRATVQSTAQKLAAVMRDGEADRRRNAQDLVMACYAGDPVALTAMATHAVQVSPAFEEAIVGANL